MIGPFRLAIALAALTMWTSLASAQDCADGKCIRIGSYNIRLFATPDASANTPNELDQIVGRIADTNQANLDVVVLQEINKNGDNWKGSDGLRAKLVGKGYAVAMEGTFGGDQPTRPQFVILLYRTSKVSLVAGSVGELPIAHEFNDGSCKYGSVRPPATAQFKSVDGQFSFRVIGVHLKSKTEVPGSPPDCDMTIRTHQGKEITAYIAKLKAEKGETNVITVGDFNAKFGDPEYTAFRQAGFESLITGNCSTTKLSECSYLGTPFANPPFKYPPELIDHIVIPSGMKEAVKGSGTIVPFGDLKKYLDHQSDHVMVWASFRVN